MSDFAIERTVLGSLLANNDCMVQCEAVGLQTKHFGHQDHRRLYAAIASCRRAGRIADAPLLKPWFPPELLGNCLVSMVGSMNVADYARALRHSHELGVAVGWIDECADQTAVLFDEVVAGAISGEYANESDEEEPI